VDNLISAYKMIKTLLARSVGIVRITDQRLLELGFKRLNFSESSYETWEKCGIEVWKFTGDKLGSYWIVDALDQAAIEKKFYYMDELELFFIACGKDIKGDQC
jgi:hypothetical protein